MHAGLEMHQVRAEKKFNQPTKVKILYFTQLLGLALGLSPRQVGVHENISDSLGFLRETRARGLLWNPMAEGLFRAVTHLDISAADVKAALGITEEALRALS